MATSALSEVYDDFTVYGKSLRSQLLRAFSLPLLNQMIFRMDRTKNISAANSHGKFLQQHLTIAKSTRMA